jgi:hypothetical protein
MRLLRSLAKPLDRPLLFMAGDGSLYSEDEAKSGVALPAVLFSDLDEASARALASLCQAHGLDVDVFEGTAMRLFTPSDRAQQPRAVAALALLVGVSIGGTVHNVIPGLAAGAAIFALFAALKSMRRRLRDQRGLFQLRDEIAVSPVADGLLAGALEAAREVRAPEVRALFRDVACEIYRLSRRAEQLRAPSSEGDLVARTLAAAPALCERLRQLAARLDALDDELAGTSEGELMQAIARLERAAAAPGADRAALAAARRDLEATLERRAAAEQQRARLAAALCGILGRLRQAYRRASVLAVGELETRELEAASAELDEFLAVPASLSATPAA